MANNRRPTSLVRDEVLREAGYKCANPTCRNILTLQLHHMVWVKDGGPSDATNLIALCGHCHDMHTHGHIPASAVRHWKGMLHALNHAFNRESMELLLFLNKPGMENAWYTADGMLRFAGLMAAGLVGIIEQQYSVGVRYRNSAPTSPPTTSVRLSLTDKGKILVDAWLKGDEDRYREALERPENEDVAQRGHEPKRH